MDPHAPSPSSIQGIVQDCRAIIQSSPKISLCCIPQTQNKLASKLAKLAAEKSLEAFVFSS